MSSRHARIRHTAALFLGALTITGALHAQSSTDTSRRDTLAVVSSPAEVVPVVAATSAVPMAARLNAPAGLQRTSNLSASAVPLDAASDHAKSPALMIVGGVTLVLGAVIGGKAGTLFMVGGAVVGLVGLWDYLK